MAKQALLNFFIQKKKRHTFSDYSNSNKRNNNRSHPEKVKTKGVHTSFTQKYDPSYIEFGFAAVIGGEIVKPQWRCTI